MRIGDYLVEVELARGGSATVYRVRDRAGGAWALKLLREVTPHARRRFEVEVGALTRLRHPHLVPVVAWALEPQPFLVMPLVEGGTLQERIEREGPMSAPTAARLGHELALALDYAHGCGVSHRDVKPDNVLVDRLGRARLTDFSLALDEDLGRSRLTQTGVLQGTPGYWAPEQCGGDTREVPGPLTDVHGLGATLFACLTGRPPYPASLDGLLRTLDPEPAPRLRSLRPDADPRLDAICRRCLAKEPGERFPDMTALARALTEVARGPALTSSTRPRRALAPWAGLAGGLAVAGLAGLGWAATRRSAAPAPATAEVDPRLARAERLIEAGALADADALLGEVAAELEPESEALRQVLLRQAAARDGVLRQQRDQLAQLTSELLAGARELRARGDFAAADETLRGLEAQVPDDPELKRERSAWRAARAQRVTELERLLDVRFRQDPEGGAALARELLTLGESPRALNLLLLYHLSRRESAETIAVCDRLLALELPPRERAQVLVARSNAFDLAGDRVGARADLDASLALAEDPRTYAIRAQLRRDGDPQGALADLTRAAELDPTPARQLELGKTAWRLNQPERAVAILEPLARRTGSAPNVFSELANAYRGVARHADAERAYSEALARATPDTNRGGIHWGRLQVRRALGDLEGALEDAERLGEIVPESGEGRFLPGLLRLDLGQEPQGRAQLEAQAQRVEANRKLSGPDRAIWAEALWRLDRREEAWAALDGVDVATFAAMGRNYAYDPQLRELLRGYALHQLEAEPERGLRVAAAWLGRYPDAPGAAELRAAMKRVGLRD
ncbi:MAG: protein kinase [Planctomycetota bacterium]